MTMLGVHMQALKLGFCLDEVECDGVMVWAWRRGSDDSWPSFFTEEDALGWMERRMTTAALFDR